MSLEKATLTNTVTGDLVEVQFNPEEYSVQRQNHFAAIPVPGLRSPLLQFVNGELQTLEMELLVDTLEAHAVGSRVVNAKGQDVRKLTQKIVGLLDIDRTLHAPPPVVFAWGSLSFTCVLTKVSQRFIMFAADGTPLRARLQVSLSELVSPTEEVRQTKRETADYSKVHVVGDGESLALIAHQHFGDPRLWRPLALLNQVDNPLALTPGQPLLIPRLPFTDPESGQVYR